ncbi:glycosyltransferase [Methylophaga sp.]|uniref:glycosyltransferase n=1 Tax=Methylophaga sp. TaxID=2024840 RepID=UPI003A8F0506
MKNINYSQYQLKLAPIILFVYNRPWHTRQTIEALQKNELAEQSDLIIYSDGPRSEQVSSQIQEVRKYLKTVNGFKSIKIIERNTNWGLANNIIDGVTEVVNQYGRIIVMEDDIVTSPAYLSFMNQALSFYQNQSNVWHVSGWNYPINTNVMSDAFFWRVMNCWGWATWADRWKHFEKNPQRLIENWSKQQKHYFDLDGSGLFWHQVTANAEGKINTWAIFWYATLHEKGGLCLNPAQSYVNNIGHDGTGEHCGNSQSLANNRHALCTKSQLNFTVVIQESLDAVSAIKLYYRKQKKPFIIRAINKVARLTIKKNIFQ